MPDIGPRPRRYDTARTQHRALACTTAGHIRRMSTLAEDDLAHGGTISTGAALQIVQAALDLLQESVKLAVRDEQAARRGEVAA